MNWFLISTLCFAGDIIHSVGLIVYSFQRALDLGIEDYTSGSMVILRLCFKPTS